MILPKGVSLGCSALVAGACGLWLQNRLLQKHKKASLERVVDESDKQFLLFLAKKYEGSCLDENILSNYSGTHIISPYRIHEPTSIKDVEQLLVQAQNQSKNVRPAGRFLSPNGIAGSKGIISMALCDKIVSIDEDRKQVTVEAGAIVDDVLKTLKKFNLTLANFSSIKEQQIGGWTQVGAHGTGARLPTVDGMITEMQIVTPNLGTMKLSNNTSSAVDREMFHLARCGLGCLGVVTEVTLQCIDYHWLREDTEVLPAKNIEMGHTQRLKEYRHVRYMWIPYTSCAVVIKSSVANCDTQSPEKKAAALDKLILLLQESSSRYDQNMYSKIANLSFTQLRDRLLDLNPLETEHVKKVNEGELHFWQNNEGSRYGPSDEILGFDCGGQQLVLEVAFPTGTLTNPSNADLKFIDTLLRRLEEANIPAPAPIEQRWTSASSSYLSPAYDVNPDIIYSWVGIIMYLPPNQNALGRANITRHFYQYAKILYDISKDYGAVPHWAKLEMPETTVGHGYQDTNKDIKKSIFKKYNTGKFQNALRLLDPKGILTNTLIQKLFRSNSLYDQ